MELRPEDHDHHQLWAEIAASGFFECPASEDEFGSTRVDDDAWHSVSTRY